MKARVRIDTLGGHTYTTEISRADAVALSNHYAREIGKPSPIGTITLEGQPHITIALRHIAALTVTNLPHEQGRGEG